MIISISGPKGESSSILDLSTGVILRYDVVGVLFLGIGIKLKHLIYINGNLSTFIHIRKIDKWYVTLWLFGKNYVIGIY